MSGTSPDPKKPLWPDPTGGAEGVWATPAGDGKGDVPEKLGTTDLYDRVVHNLEQQVPIGLLAPAHRVEHRGLELAPRLHVNMYVGDTTESLH